VGSEQRNLGELYAARAIADPKSPVSPISIPRVREARDMVYSGSAGSQNHDPIISGENQSPRNKQQRTRRFSPFTIILILLSVAIASILYIGNILAVGRLMSQMNQLELKHRQILNEQELLKAQINRLSGLERIQQLAQDQLGLRNPNQLPVWIEIDPERVAQVEEVIQQRMDKKR